MTPGRAAAGLACRPPPPPPPPRIMRAGYAHEQAVSNGCVLPSTRFVHAVAAAHRLLDDRARHWRRIPPRSMTPPPSSTIWTNSRHRRQGHAKRCSSLSRRRPKKKKKKPRFARLPAHLSHDGRSSAESGRSTSRRDTSGCPSRSRRVRGLSPRRLKNKLEKTAHDRPHSISRSRSTDPLAPEAWRHTSGSRASYEWSVLVRLGRYRRTRTARFVTFDARADRSRLVAPNRSRCLAAAPNAVRVASRVRPVDDHIGLIPRHRDAHTEPFHSRTAIAHLTSISTAEPAGVQGQLHPTRGVTVSGRRDCAWRICSTMLDSVRWPAGFWDSLETTPSLRHRQPAGSSTGTTALHRLHR